MILILNHFQILSHSLYCLNQWIGLSDTKVLLTVEQSIFACVLVSVFECIGVCIVGRIIMCLCQCSRVGVLPSVSQLVFREHWPLSLSWAESCSSDWLSLPMMPQDDRHGVSLLYDWLSADKRLCRSSASWSCCWNYRNRSGADITSQLPSTPEKDITAWANHVIMILKDN